MELLAKTMAGFEPVLERELQSLGAERIEVQKRAVTFSGDLKLLYRTNLELHTALRVLVPFNQFQVENEEQLYREIRKIDWSKYFSLDQTFAIDATVFSPHFNHSKFVALKVKDAIVDQFRDQTGLRPNVDIAKPDLRINIHISRDICTVSLDSSGESLHKRGYRSATIEAPLSEVLAAGLICLSNWDLNTPFIDPMCGSGTLLIEAAFWAYRIPPQLYREKFGFMSWQDFDADLWEDVLADAKKRIRLEGPKILGFDQSFKSLKASRENIFSAHLEGKVEVSKSKFQKLSKPFEEGLIMMNPPYDERLKEFDINGLYKEIGDRLKQEFTGYSAWILSSNKDALKHIGLRPTKKMTVMNGALECKFQRFDMYAGSKKVKKNRCRSPLKTDPQSPLKIDPLWGWLQK